MFIKAYVKQERKEEILKTIDYSTLPLKKKGCFDLPHQQDHLFTDQYWFHKMNIIPHIENHRPSMKRKILRVKHEAMAINGRRKNKSELHTPTLTPAKTFTIIPPSNKGHKTLTIDLKNKSNKYVSVKQSIVRQASDVPDYAKNLMRPCKIEAIHFSQRPSTGRKISTASFRPITAQKTKQKNVKGQVTQQDNQGKNSGGKLIQGEENRIDKIQPWQQTEQDFIIY